MDTTVCIYYLFCFSCMDLTRSVISAGNEQIELLYVPQRLKVVHRIDQLSSCLCTLENQAIKAAAERLAVPKWLRIMLFIDFKFYVPQSCRICSVHLYSNNWEVLTEIQPPIHSFNADHIQDFASFAEECQLILDFNNIHRFNVR